MIVGRGYKLYELAPVAKVRKGKHSFGGQNITLEAVRGIGFDV